MDKFDRIYQLHNVLREHRVPVSRADLARKLECSESTIFRLIRILRDVLGAPLKHDDEPNGYYYETTADGGTYELPGLRSFAVDRAKSVTELSENADDVSEKDLNDHCASSYGIFAGNNKTAVLRFSAERARWVADERSHPEPSGQFLTDGRYELRIPYRDDRELIMDNLRHGAAVEVISPDALCVAVHGQLQRAIAQYNRPKDK